MIRVTSNNIVTQEVYIWEFAFLLQYLYYITF